MTTTIDYALMAGASYFSTRQADGNKIPVPQGWVKVMNPDSYFKDTESGFEAISFSNGTEIVISYAGTYDKPLFPNPDFQADLALGTGWGSTQLDQAAAYFLSIRAANPTAQITLTGHSLGGGLAALVAVFFGVPAWTFDQAPFARSAKSGLPPNVAANLKATLLSEYGHTEAALAALTSYLQQRDANGGIPNANFVTNLNVEGEFLSGLVATFLANRIGSDFFIDNRTEGVSGTNLHAQSLLAAYLQSEKTAEQGKALNQVTYKLTDLLPMIFDKNLYANETDSSEKNFLEHLVRHEAGVRDSATGAIQVPADAMVTRFTRDLWKIAQDGGLTLTNNFIAKALTAFAMQMYYEDTTNATTPTKELFTSFTGGIRFDMADVAEKFKTAFDAGTALDLNDAKGGVHVRNYIETAFTEGERTLIQSLLPQLRDWYIQAGTTALTATDTQNRNAFLLGGTGSDTLTGGTGADLLIGNADADILQGGQGNDILLGGAGNDTYRYTTNDGFDTLLDSDGQGRIVVGSTLLAGGAEYGDARVHRDAGKHLYVDVGQGQLVIDGNMLVKNYTASQLSLTMAGPSTEADLPKLTGNASDNFIGINVYNRNPDDSRTIKATLSNGITEPTSLTGSAAAHILEGGAGSDILSGGAENDRLYADSQISVATAIANGNLADSGSNQKGDWLAGGSGDDTLVGGASFDVLSGGAGADLLIGGAGNDDILGDTDYVATSFNWTVTDRDGVRFFDPVTGPQAPVGGAADVIYSGEGNDYVWAGEGNDVAFGDGGNDRLNGNEGNDILLGGAGADTLWGEIGNDYLDGGAGVDLIQGGADDDLIIGGTEDDTLYGEAGRDTYIFNRGDGRDTVIDTRADNNIFQFGAGFNPGDVTLRLGSLMLDLGNGDEIHIAGFNQNDVFNSSAIGMFQFADGTSLTINELLARGFDLDGTAADDSIVGTNTTDHIDGRAGNDLIWGLDGNDTITGSTGTDVMNGGLGDDTYVFSAGDGATLDGTETGAAETLLDDGGSDTIRFAADIDAQNLVLIDNLDGSLVVDYSAAGQPLDRLLIDHGLNSAVEHYKVGAGDTARTLSDTQFIGEFGSGVYSGTDAAGRLHLSAGKGNDGLYAAGGGNFVSGGRGNDTLTVYGAENTILYSAGDGTDRVTTSATAGMGNVLKLSGVTADDLSLRLGANRELLLRAGSDAGDAILFSTFNADDIAAKRPFDRIAFDDGSTLSYDALLAKGFDITGTAGDDVIAGTSVTDRITGGAGNDLLLGGAGDDRYRFNSGDRQDVIQDSQGRNTVEFGVGLTAAAMTATQSLADDGQRYLDLDFGNGDRLSIMDGELGRVDSFAFAPSAGSGQAGTTLSIDQVLALLPMVNLRGGGGNEVFAGFGGNDLIDGGAGNDVVTGGDGADRLYGGLGNDTLHGDAGDDLLDGGAGNDTLAGGSGIDIYRFGLGMGQDTVIEMGGEASVLELMSGTNAFTLTARQEGDDLVLAARTGSDALRLAGYYADPDAAANWTVKTADGVVRGMSTFLQGVGEQVSTGSQFIAQFRQRWVSGWNAWHVNNGYSIGDDGVARRAHSSMTTVGTSTVLRSETESVRLDVGDFYTGDGADTFGANYWSPPASQKSFSWPTFESKTIQSSSTTTSTVIREAVLSSRTALDRWDQPQSVDSSAPFFVPVYQQAQPVQIVRYRIPFPASSATVTDHQGRVRGAWIIPGPPVPPQPTEQTVSVRKEVVDIARVYTTPISFLGAGDDRVAGVNLDGGSGNDLLAIDSDARYYDFGGKNLPGFLYGNDGNDRLMIAGETEFGDDIRLGETIMIGGRGRDRLEGGIGRTVFMLLEEDSIDTITTRGGNRTDEVVFGPGVTAESLRVLRPGYIPWDPQNSEFLQLLTPDGTGAIVQVAKAGISSGRGVEYVSFSDGARLTVAQLLDRLGDSQIVMGSTGDDTLVLGAGNDVIDGGQANDVLVGAAGSDTYRFGRGSGQDVIDQTGAAASDVDVLRFADDVLRFADDVLPSDITVFRDDQNLYLEIADSGDFVTLKSWYDDSVNSISTVEFGDGTVWAANDISVPVIAGTDGADFLYGTRGYDTMSGGAGDDMLSGGSGNDTLLGGDGRDSLIGGPGDDVLSGQGGSGYANGGPGDDTYLFDRGDGFLTIDLRSVTLASAGNAWESNLDVVRFGTGIAPEDIVASFSMSRGRLTLGLAGSGDAIELRGWQDSYSSQITRFEFADGTVWTADTIPFQFIADTDGYDLLTGTAGDDAMFGRGGNDVLSGGAGNDILFGGDGYNVLYGEAGDDFLNAGEGGYLAGGLGNDTYLFNRGGGDVTIGQYLAEGDDSGAYAGASDTDVIRFGVGVAASEIVATFSPDTGALNLSIAYGNDAIHIQEWQDTNSRQIARFEFADGTVWTPDTMPAPVITGTAGDDSLSGGAGDDRIDGGAGNDILMGGAGSDRYILDQGAGDDTVVDSTMGNAENRLVFGEGITRDSLSFETEASGLRVRYGETDSVLLQGWSAAGGEEVVHGVEFADGSQESLASLLNHAPIVVSSLADAAAVEDEAFSWTLPNGSFADLDAGDVLTYAVTGANGAALPAWVVFDAATLTLSGTARNEDVGSFIAEVRATDRFGRSAATSFTIAIANTNDAPVVNIAIANQSARENDAFLFDLPSATFVDVDARDSLVLSARLANGDPLPAWLSFDAASERLIGTPAHADAGELQIVVTATDLAGAAVSQTFALTVQALAGVTLTGTAGNDILTGGVGNDVLDGGAGRDRMTGGAGNDIYVVDNTGDVVVELPGEGIDMVQSSVSLTLAANVENLSLLGTANISGTGNALDNLLIGNVGNNTLNGGAGTDTMVGGLGNDSYYVDSTGDVVTESLDEGTDRVIASISYTLAANLENLTLTGTEAIDGTGNELNNSIVGNSGGNTLSGLGGNDSLSGGIGSDSLFGGEGNDTLNGNAGDDSMAGGIGNDTYYVDSSGDVVIESIDEGTDRVIASISYTLAANLENLTLTGTEAINGTGNELNNVIVGNSAGNVLSGLGGNDNLSGGIGSDSLFGGEGNDTLNGNTGDDSMAGGLGNDTYYVDSTGDVVTEAIDEGTDRVIASISYTLGANLENLTLTGTEVIDGTGNELNNSIVGNSGGNTLSGLGGNDSLSGGIGSDSLFGGEGNDTLNGNAGDDTMAGGLGNDSYYVDSSGDVVTEALDEGTDRVIASISYTLGANLENLTLTGTEAINGTGNELNNTIAGNSAGSVLSGLGGNDSLSGGIGSDSLFGGEGNDTLNGNAGDDTFTGGLGTDRLTGGQGNDTYRLGRGDGADTVVENDATVGNADVAQFLAGISADQIWLRHVGNNLEASIIGTTDKLTVQNWYLGGQYHVEQFKTADGKLLLDSQVENLVQAMAAFAPPAAGQTSLPPTYQDTLAPVIAANWQ
jgi:Ca2+-binding RTX toxin-like protein